MTSPSRKRVWLTVATIASVLVGLPIAGFGAFLLYTTVVGLISGDTQAGHAGEWLIVGFVAAAAGATPVVAGVYALFVTKGFKRWGSELPQRDRAMAIVAWLLPALIVCAALSYFAPQLIPW